MATAARKTPVLGFVLDVITQAEADNRRRRLEEWCSYLAADGDEFEVDEQLRAALGGESGGLVRSAVIESARAVSDAIDDVVVPAIGRLTHRYLTTKTPALPVFRDLLALLRSVEGDVYAALADAAPSLVLSAGGEGVRTAFIFDNGPEFQTWNWYVMNPGLTVPLLRGNIAHRVVSALHGRRPLFAQDDSLPGPYFDTQLIDVLATVFDVR